MPSQTRSGNESILNGILGRQSNESLPQIMGTTRNSREVIYWRKCGGCSRHTNDFNWITTGPAMSTHTAVEYSEFQAFKHATPLPQYGRIVTGKVNGQKYDITDPSTRFAYIIEAGGLHEFPIDQMIAYNWHKIPVIKQAVPQLADVVDIHCEHGCPTNRTFSQMAHYQDHISVMHKEVAQPEAIGRRFQEAVASLNKQQANVSPELLVQIVAAVAAAMQQVNSAGKE